MDELLRRAEEALRNRDGRAALEAADKALEQDETCSRAWWISLRCFQYLYPIDQYDSQNELTCARYAIRFCPKPEKYRMRKQIYQFLADKVLDVLKRDAEVLADGREILGFYQRTVYFDASGAAQKTREKDEPVMRAVEKSFSYCEAIFDFIPDSAVRGSRELNRKAAEIGKQWERTYGYLVLRAGLYHMTLPEEQIRTAHRVRERYLRAVKDREEILKKPASFDPEGRCT